MIYTKLDTISGVFILVYPMGEPVEHRIHGWRAASRLRSITVELTTIFFVAFSR